MIRPIARLEDFEQEDLNSDPTGLVDALQAFPYHEQIEVKEAIERNLSNVPSYEEVRKFAQTASDKEFTKACTDDWLFRYEDLFETMKGKCDLLYKEELTEIQKEYCKRMKEDIEKALQIVTKKLSREKYLEALKVIHTAIVLFGMITWWIIEPQFLKERRERKKRLKQQQIAFYTPMIPYTDEEIAKGIEGMTTMVDGVLDDILPAGEGREEMKAIAKKFVKIAATKSLPREEKKNPEHSAKDPDLTDKK